MWKHLSATNVRSTVDLSWNPLETRWNLEVVQESVNPWRYLRNFSNLQVRKIVEYIVAFHDPQNVGKPVFKPVENISLELKGEDYSWIFSRWEERRLRAYSLNLNKHKSKSLFKYFHDQLREGPSIDAILEELDDCAGFDIPALKKAASSYFRMWELTVSAFKRETEVAFVLTQKFATACDHAGLTEEDADILARKFRQHEMGQRIHKPSSYRSIRKHVGEPLRAVV